MSFFKAKKTKNKKAKNKSKDKEAEEAVEKEAEVQDNGEEEAEKQRKMIEDLENGGAIEDIDLTTEDWVNVNPLEIMKRYDMLRRYVRIKKSVWLTFLAYFFFKVITF